MQLGSAVSGCAPCKLPAGRTFCCCCTARTAALQLRLVVGPAAGRALNSTARRVPATFLGGRHATGDYCAQYYPFRRQASDICSSGHGAQQATFCTLMDAPLTFRCHIKLLYQHRPPAWQVGAGAMRQLLVPVGAAGGVGARAGSPLSSAGSLLPRSLPSPQWRLPRSPGAATACRCNAHCTCCTQTLLCLFFLLGCYVPLARLPAFVNH